ncbi:dTDP-4-dehydrorhamnose reductase [Marinobacterium aestuariivivens]|uniref:dTDP-4-dehydrorhamnose reductase n=1 Tax=Marinobacterium aestuariivivens TaxID=1698799 RepID=A0ABW1ZTQ0_9GAMM
MRILLTGSTGQVGFELLRSLAVFGDIVAPTRQELDLCDLEAVGRFVESTGPDLIVNAAAWTAVDAAEKEEAAAYRLNAELPALLAAYAQAQSSWLIHYSSDYVYPGSGSVPWTEASETGPLSVYGASKRAGDEAIAASGARHLIFRTSWVYSARGHNFMKTMLHLGRERDSLNVVADQIGAPTPARLIAEVTALAVSKLPRSPRGSGALAANNSGVTGAEGCPFANLHGIYHLAPHGETSWHGFARAIFTLAKEQGMELAIGPQQVAAITTEQYHTPARRPLNSRLNLGRLERALNIELPDWQSQLGLTLSEYLQNSG